MNKKQIEWCCIPVTVDDTVAELIHMTPPNQDAKQKPEFRVTKATMGLSRWTLIAISPAWSGWRRIGVKRKNVK